MITRILTIVSMAALACQAQVPQRIKWACLGNSLTAGYPQANLTYVNGTTRLSGLIGYQDTIRNFGVSSSTLLKKGDVPYWTRTISGTNVFAAVFAFKPDIISIELGTNDTKSQNWQYNSEFVADLTAMVDTLTNNISPAPQIWLMLPPPIYTNTYGINDSIMTNGVIPKIQQVAAAKGLKMLDANTRMRAIATSSPTTYYSDGVHFTARGSDSLSAILYRSFISQVTRVACIGNSITAGSTLTNAAQTAYPIRLNMLLGRNYYVKNEGLSGAYMQKAGRSPYWTTAQFRDVFNFKPNLITIALGTNDARRTQWNAARYKTDYRTMIDTLSNTISPKPQIVMLKPMPAWMANSSLNSSVATQNGMAWGYDNGIAGNGINDTLIVDSTIPAVTQVASEKGLPTIDLYAPMLMGQPYVYNVTPSWVPDGVHPRELGHDTLAHVVYRGLLTVTGISGRNTFRAANPAKTRLVPMLFSGTPNGSTRLYSLDGKSVPLVGQKIGAGIYLEKAVERRQP